MQDMKTPAEMAEQELEFEVVIPELIEDMEPVEMEEEPAPKKRLRKRKKAPFIIGGVVLLLIAGGIWWGVSRKDDAPKEEILNDKVTRGSISSVVEGSGQAKAQKSETISVGVSGTVLDVFVTEGQLVTAGTVLYRMESAGADDAVTKAKKDVEGFQKQLKVLYEGKANLSVRPDFSGKIIRGADAKTFKKGDKIGSDEELGRLIDDTKMKLVQYYSYAYEHDIYIGMSAQVSVPGVMQQLSGTVSAVNKVERISAEGAKLFSVDISIDNPGSLSEKMPASAVFYANGETISPYEQGAMEYNRAMSLKTKVGGTVISNKIQDYLKVSAGQVLMQIDGEDTNNEIFQLEQSLKTAQEALDTAQKNKNNLQATAPIDGMVTGLSVTPGTEIDANTTLLSIVDGSVLLVEAPIDERSISFIKPGMMAEIDQYGNISMGIVETVSLAGKFEQGITRFPATIKVDNAEGTLQPNSGLVYRIQASQSEDCLVLPSQCVKSVSHPETGEPLNVVFVKTSKAPQDAIEGVDGTALGVPASGYFAVPVSIGLADKFNVEILSGVEEGTEVFTQVVRQNSFQGGGGMMIG